MSGQVSLIDGHIDNENRCACCHRIIPEGSHYCIICGDVPKRKKQRQIDRIRNMSVEEMVGVIKCPAAYDLKFDKIANCRINSYQCKKCCQKYLESEVEGE